MIMEQRVARNLFAYGLSTVDARIAHRVAGIRRWTGASRRSIANPHLRWVGTTGVGYYAHYAPQLHPDAADVPLRLDQLALIKVPVLVIKPACDYVTWSAVADYQRAFAQTQLVMLRDTGHVAYLERPALYTNEAS